MNPPDALTDVEEFERALAESVEITSSAMPDSPMVSVALRAERGLRTVACTHERAGRLDALQWAEGQGPALEAVATGEPVAAEDLPAEPRWAGFARRSPGIRSLHAEPLRSGGEVLGVLTVYSSKEGGLPEQSRVVARVAAAHIGVLLRTSLQAARTREVAEQLREALATRASIDQALGIVMAQHRCTAGRAFEILRRVSQERNVKLHHVAAMVVEKVSGEPPSETHFEDPPHRADRA
ncbi:GAF and ANTAR domain-containing protein [Nonomuraea pusilla]|uniref:GAF and ANTAR domain-containing protein n=1 Tax=Nonomuraea pusilla TaxID=46177 RepID=UPI003320F902